jgi:CDP-diacylglycerol--glycerol-3-phosphate 3-phosphatidyltransferase
MRAAGEPGGAATTDASRPALWNIPNQLTIARLVLSVVFFVLLAVETHQRARGRGLATPGSVLLNISLPVFVLAVLTDFLDGYLARRWGLISTFGRIADPFADKIIICGGFIMLTGVAPDLVEPWFAVIIMIREFLVSGLRAFFESRGVAFGAAWSGKFKMLVQSITIPLVLLHEANFAPHGPSTAASICRWVTIFFLTATLIWTIGSCFTYIARAARLLRAEKG